MPRNGSGIYTLPPTNPVVPFTAVSTSWANPTMQDIADAITESLDRSGRGGMTAPFRIADGIISAPGLAFTNETNLGLYRPSSAVMAAVVSGISVFSFNSDRVVSSLRQDFYGFTTYRYTGTYNWKVYSDVSGVYSVRPSVAVNGDTYDAAKGFSINPTSGLMTVSSLSVVGAFTAGTFAPTSIATGTITATGAISSDVSLSAPVFISNYYRITASATAGVAAVNFAVSQSLVMTLAAPLTITSIAGLTLGNIGRITFKASNNAVTFPATVKWPGPTFAKPDFNAGTLKITVVVLEYDGTNYLANAAVY